MAECQETDARAAQRSQEFREQKNDVLVISADLSLRPTVDGNAEICVLLARHSEDRLVDEPEADVRHALHDELQKASVGELGVVESRTIQRPQDILENFAGQG